MKRIVSVFLILSLCLCSIVAFASCLPTKKHSFATEWSKDEECHFHVCQDEGCTIVTDKTPHTWDEGKITTPATESAEGVKTFTCTACGQTKTESVAYVAPAIKTTVTKEEWDAFMASTNYSIAAEVYDKDGVLSASMEIKATETSTYQSYDGEAIITVLKDSVWYQVVKVEDQYIGLPMEEGSFRNSPVGDFLMGQYPDFALWTYDEEEKAYTVKGDSEDDFIARIYFENGAFTHMRVDEDGEYQNITVSAIGTTTIDVPEFSIFNMPADPAE